MPGKYSHPLVMAHYSSQGIINLPNDDYLRCSAPPRADSATACRQWTTSYFTDLSGRRSLTSRSVTSLGRIPRSRLNSPTLTETSSTQQRVIIIASDSESEADIEDKAEDQDEWVRLHPRPAPRSWQAVQPQSSDAFPPGSSPRQQPVFAQARASSSGRQLVVEEKVKTLNSQKNLTAVETPRKRTGRVRALIQARHEAEMKNSAAADAVAETEDAGLSLREFLKTGRKSGSSTERQLTVQQFLDAVPSPLSVEPHSPRTKDPPSQSGARTSVKRELRKTNSGSPYRLQIQKNSEQAKSHHMVLKKSFELDRGSVEIANPRIHPPRTPAQGTVKVHENERQRPSGAIARDPPAAALSKVDLSGRAPHTRCGPQPTAQPVSQLRNIPGTESRATKDGSSHKKTQSSLSSLDSSKSSIFGVSSIGAKTQATSGQSPSSRQTNKSERNRGWDLPLSQQDQQHDASADIFQDIRNTIIIFTSDDDEDNDEVADMPTPRLQSIPESGLCFGGQWGTISTRRNTADRDRDADERSEMSAVFPPDIGRYRYGGKGEEPLAMAVSGMAEEGDQPEWLKSFRAKPKKNRAEVGLQRKLKKKAST